MSRKPTSLGRNVAMLSHASVRPCWKSMASMGSDPPSPGEPLSLDEAGLPSRARAEPRSPGSGPGRRRPAWYGHARADGGCDDVTDGIGTRDRAADVAIVGLGVIGLSTAL